MSLIVPNGAEQIVLKNWLNFTAPQDFYLKLFSSNTTPDANTVVGDLTETTGGGYAHKSLTGTSWTVATNAGGRAEGTYAAQTFTFTGVVGGTGIIYGYYYVQQSSGLLVAIERFASSFTPVNSGDAVTFTPKLQIFSEN